ncbi:MAG: hypothetical protein JO127_10150 [Caulobacteraceae bacterium]|nr:hypothetical protein [Caulobacteraceae bacterium]
MIRRNRLIVESCSRIQRLRARSRRKSGSTFAERALGLAIGLAACQAAAPQLDPQAETIARAFYDEVRSGGDIQADPHLAHELKNANSEAEIAQFRALIPTDPPDRVETRDVSVVRDSVGTTTRLSEVYHYGQHSLVAQVALFKSPSGVSPVIVGFQVTPGPDES